MVENRKLFYAISVLLLSCCQIITMFPHNADTELGAGSDSSSSSIGNNGNINRGNANSNASSSSSSNSKADTSSNNSDYNRANVDSTSNQSYGNNDDDSEFIIAVERKHQQQQQQQQQQHHRHHQQSNDGLNLGNMGVWEAPDSMASENVDDLIFLDKRPINQHHQHHQQEELQHQRHEYVAQLPTRPTNEQQKQQTRYQHFEIHHHLSADGTDSSSSSSSSSGSTSDEHSASLTHTTFASSTSDVVVASKDAVAVADDDDVDVDVDVDDMADAESETEAEADADVDADAAMPPHEIELQPDNNEEAGGVMSMAAVTPLDLSDFLALIPAAKVKAIVAHYYRNDPEVQRAHAFMSSRDFISLKHHIIVIPEMSAFLRYLNSSGLDLVKFVTTLTNMTTVVGQPPPTSSSTPTTVATTTEKGQTFVAVNDATSTWLPNDIEYAQKQSEIAMPTTPATNIAIQTEASSSATATALPSSSAASADVETTTAKEQLNGLHGLVDSILDVLPQDQILATFFDKLESNEQFSKLVGNIGSPEFSRILNNMQNSVPLRNLIFTLHNNGIYVIRIVDSLKSYFFLGGF